jgi:hypothetical protein
MFLQWDIYIPGALRDYCASVIWLCCNTVSFSWLVVLLDACGVPGVACDLFLVHGYKQYLFSC